MDYNNLLPGCIVISSSAVTEDNNQSSVGFRPPGSRDESESAPTNWPVETSCLYHVTSVNSSVQRSEVTHDQHLDRLLALKRVIHAHTPVRVSVPWLRPVKQSDLQWPRDESSSSCYQTHCEPISQSINQNPKTQSHITAAPWIRLVGNSFTVQTEVRRSCSEKFHIACWFWWTGSEKFYNADWGQTDL